MAKIFAAQTKRHREKYQYRIKVPKNYKESVALDKVNQNTLWQDAIKKEMDNIIDLKTSGPLRKVKRRPKGILLFLCT